MRVGVIIQARIGSIRLPGKVLMDLCGKPIVEHVYLRAIESKMASEVFVATSNNTSDDILAHFLEKKGIPCYRGDEDNVLKRYFELAYKEKLDIIVRLTSDNPLVDYIDIDILISYLKEHNLDYITKCNIPYGANVEVFTFSALEKTYVSAKETQDLEHVTRYIINHPDVFRVKYLKTDNDLSEFRITVDTKNDYDKISIIYKKLYKGNPIPLKEAINFLKTQMDKVILGTAQLGMTYGINNKTRFSEKNSISILESAYRAGIKILDTAGNYGESEEIIGIYQKNKDEHFKIITKFTLDNCNSKNIEKIISNKLKLSLKKLNVPYVSYFFIHHFMDLKGNNQIMKSLLKLKLQGKFEKIGVSVYEPRELEYILQHYSDLIDSIQIPFNIADTRWYKYFEKIKLAGIEIHARSIFLQGIFFKEDHEIKIKNYEEFININNKIKQIAEELKMSVLALLIYIVYFNPYINYLVIGMDNPKQVWDLNEAIIRLKKYELNYDSIIEKVIKTFSGTPEYVLNPSKWII